MSDSFADLENFITSHESQGYLSQQCFSPSVYQAEKKALQMAKDSETPKLLFFANNGYRSYFYFKSNNKNVYLIEFFLGEIYDYSIM